MILLEEIKRRPQNFVYDNISLNVVKNFYLIANKIAKHNFACLGFVKSEFEEFGMNTFANASSTPVFSVNEKMRMAVVTAVLGILVIVVVTYSDLKGSLKPAPAASTQQSAEQELASLPKPSKVQSPLPTAVWKQENIGIKLPALDVKVIAWDSTPLGMNIPGQVTITYLAGDSDRLVIKENGNTLKTVGWSNELDLSDRTEVCKKPDEKTCVADVIFMNDMDVKDSRVVRATLVGSTNVKPMYRYYFELKGHVFLTLETRQN